MRVHGDRLRFGVHSGQAEATFDELLDLWTRAEALGYDWVSAFDHFRPVGSSVDTTCLEGSTLVAALATSVPRIRFSVLVFGIVYRHPALLANLASTLDHISGGRFECAVGATWHDGAQSQYGINLPPIGQRMDMLSETCHVMRDLWESPQCDFEGEHYQLSGAQLAPKPVQPHLPLVIGGAGRQRLLRIVAEHADIWNAAVTSASSYGELVDALGVHCRAVGRSVSDIRQSVLFRAILRATEIAAEGAFQEMFGPLPADAPERQAFFVGTPQQCVEYLGSLASLGAADFLVNVRGTPDWETLRLLATEVSPALISARAERN
jgi:alkanesulfonate monooxygenase SsuD/methylene tetrahydromethanopterin reductase-like flavin-dependent oxidoreductase (luciferase family)